MNLKATLRKWLRGIGFVMLENTSHDLKSQFASLHKATQLSLILQYRGELRAFRSGLTNQLPSFDEVELRCCSQNGEDGILLYIFALIGTTNKKVVEICCGNGIECNAANLILHHGWYGLLIDGNARLIEEGKKIYKQHKDTFSMPPFLKHAWVTKYNVNEVIATEYGFSGEIDLLSLDMDGVDYWILKEIDIVSPRVIVLEYANIWHTSKSVTVPYDDNFDFRRYSHGFNFSGASLPAFIKILDTKGYRYVGSQSLGFNAFFVRNGIGEDCLPQVSAETIFKTPKVIYCTQDRMQLVENLPWTEV